MSKAWAVWLIVFVFPAIAGCIQEGHQAEESKKIKILYDNKDLFMSDFGELYLSKHPDAEFEVISLYDQFNSGKNTVQAFEEVMRQEPDVLALDIDRYAQFAAEGKLYDLNLLISRDSFDLEHLAPAVVELLKMKGEGRLYGLAPTFSAEALFYNIDLFDKYGIPYPTEGMSWEDVLQLAYRFPVDEQDEQRVYGLQLPDVQPYYFAMKLGKTHGISLVDAINGKITANTDTWKNILHTVVEAYRSKAILIKQTREGMRFDPYDIRTFLEGKVAMLIRESGLIMDLRRSKEALNWAFTSPPVDPNTPDKVDGIWLQRILAIRSQSPNIDAAWNLIRFILSDEYARIRSRSEPYAFLTRVGYSDARYGVSLDMFYRMKPAEGLENTTEQLPPGFVLPYVRLSIEEIDAAVNGDKTVDQALQALQERAQQEWDKASMAEQQSADRQP
jgi:multiple sugar transport system substrate-binding protein